MDIGQLDRRCRIEYPGVTGQDDFGGEIIGWLPLAVVWANVRDEMPSRAESVLQGLEVARNQTRVRLRWRSDITSAMRLIIYRPNPITYEVVGGPAELGRKEYLELMVERLSS